MVDRDLRYITATGEPFAALGLKSEEFIGRSIRALAIGAHEDF